MITLHVENYCDGCEDFEPEVSRMYGDEKLVLQQVYCIWRDRCARIYSAAKEGLKGEVNDHSK